MCSFELIEVLIRYNGSEVEEEDYCSGPEGNLRRSCRCCWRDLKVGIFFKYNKMLEYHCLLYTSPSPRDGLLSRMPSSA